MLSVLYLLTDYHRANVHRQLLMILPDAEAVATALAGIDYCHAATELPWAEVARPYMHIITATGTVLQPEQLLQLMQWAPRWLITWEHLVLHYILPTLQQGGPRLSLELSTMFTKKAA
jgi:hypothetical protein